jgi:hypothetical protein
MLAWVKVPAVGLAVLVAAAIAGAEDKPKVDGEKAKAGITGVTEINEGRIGQVLPPDVKADAFKWEWSKDMDAREVNGKLFWTGKTGTHTVKCYAISNGKDGGPPTLEIYEATLTVGVSRYAKDKVDK